VYRARKSGERYGQNVCTSILAISSAFSIPKLRTWVVGWNPAVRLKLTSIRFVTFCTRKRPILPAMESTKQENPIYRILIIHMELSKATVNIPFPYTCSVVTNILDRTFFSQRQAGDIYAKVLHHDLPALLENVPLQTRYQIYY